MEDTALNYIIAIIKSETFWTAIGSIGTIITLYYIYRQIANARNVTSYEFLRKEDDRFKSEEMECYRINLSMILLLTPDNYKNIDENAPCVLSYFEDLGLMLKKGLASDYFIWTFNCYYVIHYWKATEKFIEWLRKEDNDPTWYSEFEYLYYKMLKYEKKMTKKKLIDIVPNKEKVEKFLKEELHVKLRPFVISDIDSVIEIEKSSFNETDAYQLSRFEELYKQHPKGFIVAEILGQVIGYIIGYVSDEVGEIDSIAIDERYRHFGIARKLVQTILNDFKQKGIKKFSLEVRTTNESAILFHKSMGFEVEKVYNNYYDDGADAYLMTLNFE
ncbi:MAG: ribosomal-protein-alanine N-acetyltransferase [Deltaproteobacteria bacterium]|nr:ribosomal-protein-alanine N-acetyltransferase [Deltaproteobacteria bacterium]